MPHKLHISEASVQLLFVLNRDQVVTGEEHVGKIVVLSYDSQPPCIQGPVELSVPATLSPFSTTLCRVLCGAWLQTIGWTHLDLWSLVFSAGIQNSCPLMAWTVGLYCCLGSQCPLAFCLFQQRWCAGLEQVSWSCSCFSVCLLGLLICSFYQLPYLC